MVSSSRAVCMLDKSKLCLHEEYRLPVGGAISRGCRTAMRWDLMDLEVLLAKGVLNGLMIARRATSSG